MVAPSQVSFDLVSEVTAEYRGSYQVDESQKTVPTSQRTYVVARCHSDLPAHVEGAENTPGGLDSRIANGH